MCVHAYVSVCVHVRSTYLHTSLHTQRFWVEPTGVHYDPQPQAPGAPISALSTMHTVPLAPQPGPSQPAFLSISAVIDMMLF